MIRHLVFLRYAGTISQDTRNGLMRDLSDLRHEIDGLEVFGTRENLSPETAFTHGLTEMFWIDFRDEAARDAYLFNKTHKRMGTRLMSCLDGGNEGISVCDIRL